jgi:transposase InsO family protein
MQTNSIGGNRYFLLVIDEATCFSVLTLLKHKDDASDVLPDIFTQLETQTGKKVVHFRTDGGGEFVNNSFTYLLKQRGTIHEITTPYSPESNGRAERANRTIMEKVRCMLAGAGLPNMFWGEAAHHANLLRNLSPVTGRTKTPWELFFRRSPQPNSPKGIWVIVLRTRAQEATQEAGPPFSSWRAGRMRH